MITFAPLYKKKDINNEIKFSLQLIKFLSKFVKLVIAFIIFER
jgi:hypothetical protein